MVNLLPTNGIHWATDRRHHAAELFAEAWHTFLDIYINQFYTPGRGRRFHRNSLHGLEYQFGLHVFFDRLPVHLHMDGLNLHPHPRLVVIVR